MLLECPAQRWITGVVRRHDRIGRFRIVVDVIQIVRAKDVVNPALVQNGGIDVDDVGCGFVKSDERCQQAQVFLTAGLRLRLEQLVPVTVDQRRGNTGQLLQLRAHGVKLCLPGRMPQIKQPQGGNDHDDASRQHAVQQRAVEASKKAFQCVHGPAADIGSPPRS